MPAQSDSLVRAQTRITAWMAHYAILVTRVAVGLIYVWFGMLKFQPGLSAAEDLARRTLATVTFGVLPPDICVYALAGWECLIGIGLLSGRFLKVTLTCLFLQLIGTFLPLFLFPDETWKAFPFAPTLEGQYIIKNFALVASATVLAATLMGGRIVPNESIARRAERLESYVRGTEARRVHQL